jgi:hypothetical protein
MNLEANYVIRFVAKKPVYLVVALWLLLSLGAAVQQISLGITQDPDNDKFYTKYNNYIIFQQSHHHLFEGKNLYVGYEDEHRDLFKYSPTFALLFGFFSYFPVGPGLVLWNLLNAMLLLLAVVLLPKPGLKVKAAMLLFLTVELVTSIQNSQSNALIAALIILTFVMLERKRYLLAALCLMIAVFIKPFALVGLALYLLYPGKLKLAAFTLFWFLVLLAAPLLFVSLSYLQFQYQSWFTLLQHDHSASYGLSVMGVMHNWFGIHVDKVIVLTVAAILFMLPFIRIGRYGDYLFRVAILCSILIWVVIFNHMAESPTFIIAMSGVAIWFFSQPFSRVNLVLAVSAFVLTSLSPTDIFPESFRDGFFVPWCIKVVPCILIWGKIIYDLLNSKTNQYEH